MTAIGGVDVYVVILFSFEFLVNESLKIIFNPPLFTMFPKFKAILLKMK